MVREARFAFDDDFEDANPHSNEDFTEEDDRFLDAFAPPHGSRRTSRPRAGKEKPHGSSEQEKKHLAGADWLTPNPSSRVHRRKLA